jgi:flagellar hook-basal body complex protein FliE
MPINSIGLSSDALESSASKQADLPNLEGIGDSSGVISSPESGTDQPKSSGFAKLLVEAAGDVNQMQVEADEQAQLLATGAAENPHEAVIAVEKADLALELTAKVTEKALGAYRRVSQMQL